MAGVIECCLMATQDNPVGEWLIREINTRGWSQAELARRSSMSPSQISRVISGAQSPGLDTLTGVARALGLTLEQVLRRAEILPDHGEVLTEARDWSARLMVLSPEIREAVIVAMDNVLRASELCGLAAKDVDFKNSRVWVMGKGKKERFLPISPDTRAVIWKYLNKERGDEPTSSPLFAMMDGRPMTRVALLQLLRRLGERAGVRDVHPHRFRHSFAIQFLRNGGDVYALQAALGHTTLEMVRRYLQLAQTDIERAHETASPVAKWRLR